MSDTPPAFIKLYDLLAAAAYERALLDRQLWGVLYTSVSFVSDRHAILTFNPAPDPRWRAWEAARRRMILDRKATA